MKKVFNVAMCIPFLLCLGIPNALAQDEDEKAKVELIFGPRVGVSWVIVNSELFNESVQHIFPDEGQTYFPVFTQFGVNFEQRIRLGTTKSHFALQEVIILGGLDQNIALPSFSFLIGYRGHTGLEFGLGPNVSMSRSADGIGIALSVVYAAGWTFSIQNVFVPVNISVVPTPSDGHPRITFLTGFNFKL